MKQNKRTHEHSPQNTVDHLLLIFVILTAVSGKILDGIAVGEPVESIERQQESGHTFWLCTHIIIASAFTLLSLIHFKHHWGWFKTLPHKLKARKKESLFLLVAFIVLLISGIFVTLCKTHVSGFAHAVAGFLCLIVSIYHFYVRHVSRK